MDRREFLAKAGLAATWVGISVRVSGCGDDGGTAPDDGGGNEGDLAGAISANHGHAVTITSAQLTAGQAVVLTLDGPTDDHTHIVSLTAQDVMDIAGGTRVSRASSNDSGHTHVVTFN